MERCALLFLAFVCVHGVPTRAPLPNSCKDIVTDLVAGNAIHDINQDRTTGYIFRPERVSNVLQTRHGESGMVFYLTIDITETRCHVLSKKSYKDCDKREISDTPVYGQCKAVIYINIPHSVSRLYKYSCRLRPLATSKISRICPDCPVLIPLDGSDVVKTAKMGLEKFNTDSTLPNFFAILNIVRAKAQGGLINMHNVEFTIQETVCSNKTDLSELSKCELMTCEFAHKGFCRATHTIGGDGREYFNYKCEIYEPQAAEEEKKRHLEATDHNHDKTLSEATPHDHAVDHTRPHSHSTTPASDHANPHGHHHTHGEGHGKAHGHAHSHEHSHDPKHDHVHVHHDQAHNHAHDQGVHPAHHNYGHAKGETHEHDHELALDHEHKHGHIHEHEHHHHHHVHPHETTKRKLERAIHVLPSLDRPVTLPIFPDQEEKPNTGDGFILHPDPDVPGENEPVIGEFPKTLASSCPAEFILLDKLIQDAFDEDPEFKVKSAV